MTLFRKAHSDDFASCWQLIDNARWKMIRDGRCQWTPDYPSEAVIRQDIALGHAFVLTDEERLVAFGAVVMNGEPAYTQPSARWLTHGDYFVIHRLAVDTEVRGRGYGRLFIQEAEQYALRQGVGSLKIDTNFDNPQMLSILRSMGYVACGEIDYGEKGMRMAFEKRLSAE